MPLDFHPANSDRFACKVKRFLAGDAAIFEEALG